MAKFKLEDGTEIEAFSADEVKSAIEAETGGLKAKVEELLGEKKTVSQKAKDLEEKQRLADEDRLKEKEEFKTLYEREQAEKRELQEKHEEFQSVIKNKELESASMAVALSLTQDTQKAELLKKEVMYHARYNDGEDVTFEMGGLPVEREGLLSHLTESYPFLVDGSKASGGGAGGATKSGGAAKAGDMGGSKQDRKTAIKARFNLEE
jgi:hypothetical protein